MSFRGILLLLVALSAAGLTATFARYWISAERAALLASMPAEAPHSATPEVLVASANLPAGTLVKAGHLTWRAWPAEGVAKEYAVKGRRSKKDFIGAVVRNAIAAGQPVSEARIVHAGERGFLAAVLAPGKRAVSVPVNATTGISGFVFPGDWVDVVLTARVRSKDEKGEAETRFFSETLLTDIRVLAIDQKVENADGTASVAKTATLEVEPKQAEVIAISLEMGSLSLSLQSLAREQDAFARLAREIGADPEGAEGKPSYTLDEDVYYMKDALRGRKGVGGGSARQVNVLRGGKAELATF